MWLRAWPVNVPSSTCAAEPSQKESYRRLSWSRMLLLFFPQQHYFNQNWTYLQHTVQYITKLRELSTNCIVLSRSDDSSTDLSPVPCQQSRERHFVHQFIYYFAGCNPINSTMGKNLLENGSHIWTKTMYLYMEPAVSLSYSQQSSSE